MKLSVIVAAAAIALGGTALANDNTARTGARDHAQAQRTGETARDKAEGLGQKMRRGMHRISEKTRQVFHRKDGGADRERQATDAERARRERMDSAYSNWERRQADREKR